jgi:hypothetical protein
LAAKGSLSDLKGLSSVGARRRQKSKTDPSSHRGRGCEAIRKPTRENRSAVRKRSARRSHLERFPRLDKAGRRKYSLRKRLAMAARSPRDSFGGS